MAQAVKDATDPFSFFYDVCQRTGLGEKAATYAFLDYAKVAAMFGEYEDEAAGDHFYNFSVRALALDIMKNRDHSGAMRWATGNIPIEEQLRWFQEKCAESEKNYKEFQEKYTRERGKLYESTIILHGRLHYGAGHTNVPALVY